MVLGCFVRSGLLGQMVKLIQRFYFLPLFSTSYHGQGPKARPKTGGIRTFGQYSASPAVAGKPGVWVCSVFLVVKIGVWIDARPITCPGGVFWQKCFHCHHHAFATARAKLWVAAIQQFKSSHPVPAFKWLGLWGNTQLATDHFNGVAFVARCQVAKMPYLDKPHREHMAKEPLQEITGTDLHYPGFRCPVIDPREGYLPIPESFDPVVADGHPVRVSAYVFHYMVAGGHGLFGIYHPFFGIKRVPVFLAGGQRATFQFNNALLLEMDKPVGELSAEHFG
jgi:hypothetical protein